MRTDPEPITRRWPELGEIQRVHWVGGTFGEDWVPGPSSYFIEAVVVLTPANVARLTAEHRFIPAPPPDPPAALRAMVPGSGSWLRSEEVDQSFGPDDWDSVISLNPDAVLVYVSATGE